ncbi:hypothetical protein Dimus_036990 [Dionaea muscipula]
MRRGVADHRVSLMPKNGLYSNDWNKNSDRLPVGLEDNSMGLLPYYASSCQSRSGVSGSRIQGRECAIRTNRLLYRRYMWSREGPRPRQWLPQHCPPSFPKAGKVKDVPKIRLLTNEMLGAYPSLAVWKSKTKNYLNSKNEHGGTMAGEGDP